jgi:hypothetical protein
VARGSAKPVVALMGTVLGVKRSRLLPGRQHDAIERPGTVPLGHVEQSGEALAARVPGRQDRPALATATPPGLKGRHRWNRWHKHFLFCPYYMDLQLHTYPSAT